MAYVLRSGTCPMESFWLNFRRFIEEYLFVFRTFYLFIFEDGHSMMCDAFGIRWAGQKKQMIFSNPVSVFISNFAIHLPYFRIRYENFLFVFWKKYFASAKGEKNDVQKPPASFNIFDKCLYTRIILL